jgi:tetratricopeptide (TPR) repeat protein
MSENALDVWKRYIPINSQVRLRLTHGEEIRGRLIEFAGDLVVIAREGKPAAYRANIVEEICVEGADEARCAVGPQPAADSKDESRAERPDEVSIANRLTDIVTRFRTGCAAATLDYVPVAFQIADEDFPRGPAGKGFREAWLRAKQKYDHAAQIRELAPKFWRLPGIIADLKRLMAMAPHSAGVLRLEGHCEHLSGNNEKALEVFAKTAHVSGLADDWLRVSAMATQGEQPYLALYSLGKFLTVDLGSIPETTWYVFGRLAFEGKFYSALRNRIERFGEGTSAQPSNLDLETLIYLVHASGDEEASRRLVAGMLAGKAFILLCREALETLTDQPTPELSKAIKAFEGGFFDVRRASPSPPKTADLIPQPATRNCAVTISAPAPKTAPKNTSIQALQDAMKSPKWGSPSWKNNSRRSNSAHGGSRRGAYDLAKRAHLEKDFQRAEQLYLEAIRNGDRVESAIKDCASLYAQQGRHADAADFLIKHRKLILDQRSVDNMLIGFLPAAGRYEEAVKLLHERLERAGRLQQAEILCQIAFCWQKAERYDRAIAEWQRVARFRTGDTTVLRNLAFCRLKTGAFDEAERILKRVITDAPGDQKAQELLTAISEARTTGRWDEVDRIGTNAGLTDFFMGDVSGFAQFFLDNCEFQGVAPEKVQRGEWHSQDVWTLAALADKLGPKRAEDRAGYYLSAAKVALLLQDDREEFFCYLCRCFGSKGDAVILEGRNLDVAREFYCEVLSVFEGIGRKENIKDGVSYVSVQDAETACVRFLFSCLGRDSIPLPPDMCSISRGVGTVLAKHPDPEKVFDALLHLSVRSNYMTRKILSELWTTRKFMVMAHKYLASQGLNTSSPIREWDAFTALWDQLRRNRVSEMRSWSGLCSAFRVVQLDDAWLENAMDRLRELQARVYYDLDRVRLGHLADLFREAADLCRQDTFEERERLCIQIEGSATRLIEEIHRDPTRFSIEDIVPVVEGMRKSSQDRLLELYERSKPEVTLRLSFEQYAPDANKQICVQVVVSNAPGNAPAESLELVACADEGRAFESGPAVRIAGSLRGGDSRTVQIPLKLSDSAIDSQAFSAPISARYSTRTKEIITTGPHSFSIRLYSQDEFEDIENPYASWAEGGPVWDPAMFFGREELIKNITSAMQKFDSGAKRFVIYGQKRTGKSSILYHIKRRLEADGAIVVIDLGNIGALLDGHSEVPLYHRLLWSLLSGLRDAVEDNWDDGDLLQGMALPSDKDFFSHQAPALLFSDTLKRCRRVLDKAERGGRIRLAVLIDEFSYIHGQIVAGNLSGDFMKSWKALMERDFFSVVLAGQDVMPRFKQEFGNEFGIFQDERVSYLQREEAEKLIVDPIRIGGRSGESRYREQAVQRILELTAGSPFYIQILCNRLVEYMNRKRAALVTDADVEHVKDELVKGVNCLGLDKFENLVNSGDTSSDAIPDEDALSVLTHLAHQGAGAFRGGGGPSELQGRDVSRILDDLVNREVLRRERNGEYTIRVGLFREWLVANRSC